MSRTRHHIGQKRNKCGFDFWSRRPGNSKGVGGSGPYAKLVTHRRERLANTALVRVEVAHYVESDVPD